jgi:hypothetical protein
MKIVFGQHVALHSDLEHRRAPCRFKFNFTFALSRAGNLFEHFFDFGTESLQDIVIVSKNFHGNIGADSLEHFVEAHLDRLRDHYAHTRIQILDFRRDDLRQFFLGDWPIVDLSPFALRFVVNVKVAIARRHWVGRNFRAADARKDVRDFRNPFLDFLLRLTLLFGAFVDINAARSIHHHGERAFVELGNEICAESIEDHYG